MEIDTAARTAARTATVAADVARDTELRLRLDAAVAMAPYPQYQGHFDNYRLVWITADVVTKGGLRFAAGEYALAAPARLGAFQTVWSNRGTVDISVDTHLVVDVVRAV